MIKCNLSLTYATRRTLYNKVINNSVTIANTSTSKKKYTKKKKILSEN